MAKALGVSPSTYNKYETNNQIPRLDFIQNICKQFKVSADWLIGVNNQNIVDLEEFTIQVLQKFLCSRRKVISKNIPKRILFILRKMKMNL